MAPLVPDGVCQTCGEIVRMYPAARVHRCGDPTNRQSVFDHGFTNRQCLQRDFMTGGNVVCESDRNCGIAFANVYFGLRLQRGKCHGHVVIRVNAQRENGGMTTVRGRF